MIKIFLIFLLLALTIISVKAENIWHGNEFYIVAPPLYQEQLEIAEINIVISHEPTTKCLLEKPNGDRLMSTLGNKYQTIYNIPVKEMIETGTEHKKSDLLNLYWANSYKLQTNKDVSVWVNIKIGDNEENYNLLPKKSLGKSIKIITNEAEVFDDNIYPDFFQITAAFDNTKIDINFADIEINNYRLEKGDKFIAIDPNVKFTILLNEGESVGISNFYLNKSLTGSVINSDKPISVISGNWSPEQTNSNVLIESMISSEQNGKNYHLIPFSDEEYNVKILAFESGTEINIDGDEVISLDGSSINQKQSFHEFKVNSNKIISSNKPIMVVQYPKLPTISMVSLNPIEHYSDSYTSLSNGQTKYLIAPIDKNSQLIESINLYKENVNEGEIELEFISDYNEVLLSDLNFTKYGLFKINYNGNFEVNGESIALYVGDEDGIFSEQAHTKLEQVSTTVERENKFNIHPLPASDFINISNYVGNVKIVNALGLEVWSGFVGTEHKIDISKLVNGFYLIILDNQTTKLIKY